MKKTILSIMLVIVALSSCADNSKKGQTDSEASTETAAFPTTETAAMAETTAEAADGALAPDFTLNDLSGKPLTLSSLRGKYVILDHGNGLTTLYAHLASWQVNVGDTLQAGDTIGVGGNTGRSFGAHLHFEMRFNGTYIDPATVFNFEEGTFINAMTEIDEAQLQVVEADYQKELAKHRYYKVRRGDCLGKIARKYGISITRLKQLNGLKGNMIRPGQVLRCS